MAQLHDTESGPGRIIPPSRPSRTSSRETGEEVPEHWPRRGEMDSRLSLNILRIVNVLMIAGFAALIAYMTHATMWHVKASSRWLEHNYDQ